MHQLPDRYPQFFDLLERSSKAEEKKNVSHIGYFIGIDAEWYESEGRNVVLSYQIATCSRNQAKNIIKYVPHGKRLQLAEIIELGIRSIHDGDLPEVSPGGKVRVVLVAHNFAAEWSVLADRDADYITKRLSLIRKTPITDGHAIKLKLGNNPLEVKIFDTMLLAPASHRSLAKLSSLLGKNYEEKVSIKQRQIEHMDRYLREDPDGFEKYALRDSEICLKLFFLLQKSLNELAFGPECFKKLFRTLASAGVSSFISSPGNEWFKEYLLILGQVLSPTKKQKMRLDEYPNSKVFPEVYKLIKRSYLGGRNESYLIGKTENYDGTRNRIWIDIDLSSAYPSSMALCPLIDLHGTIRQTTLDYGLTQKAEKALLKEKIPPELIQQAKDALSVSPVAFDQMLQGIKLRSHARLIRYHATIIDNSLIKRWQKMTSDDAAWEPDSYVIPGFARIRFSFPKHVRYPCIPIKHSRYGLIYPQSGETVATAPEILLAISAGAQVDAITSVELPIATKDTQGNSHNKPFCFFNDHLRKALEERAKHKNQKGDAMAQVYEKLLKEFINSFYGKFSQSINPRKMFRPSTGEMVTLGPSTITEPSVASITTGLTRAVISAILLAIERYNRGRTITNQVEVLSATTDGLLIGLSRQPGYSVEQDYYVRRDGLPVMRSELKKDDPAYNPIDLQNLLTKFGHTNLLETFAQELPIRQLIQSRNTLVGSREYLEIKHLVDEVISVKTRGQIGLLASGDTPLLARFGHKPPLSELITDPEEYKRIMDAGGVIRNNEDGKWIQGQLARIENGLEKIETYTFINLTSFRKMLESEGQIDLVRQTRQQRFNFDFDWKRKLLSDSSPQTEPYETLDEMLLYRRQMEAIRKSGRLARPEHVRHCVILKQKTSNSRGGDAESMARQFLRGVVQQHIPLQTKLTYIQIVNRLNQLWKRPELGLTSVKIWRVDDLKNAKRRVWEPGVQLRTLAMTQLLKALCDELGADEELATGLLFIAPEYLDQNAGQIKEVIRAVLHAPGEGIEPFCKLFQQGLLPGKTSMLAVLQPVLTDTMLKECNSEQFMPARRYTSERPSLIKLFRRIGLNRKQAEDCTRVLIQPSEKPTKPRRNPGQKRCLDHFVMALQLSDVKSVNIRATTIIDRLSRFGLHRSHFYTLRKSRLTPRSLTNTPENHKQIAQMAKALRLDPTPYLDLLIDS